MIKTLILIIFLLLYSCGADKSTNSIYIDYYPDDQKFLDDLIITNDIELESLKDSIKIIEIDSMNTKYYQIAELNFNGIGLDSIPPSISNLSSLNVLNLNGNHLKFFTESICIIFNQLESLNIDNNDICTHIVPDCIINSRPISEFYNNQRCDIIPDREDLDFVPALVSKNKQSWVNQDSIEFLNELNSLTTWETFIEDEKLTSRIIEIRYINKGIEEIPVAIEDLDKLERLELQENQIERFPSGIDNLKQLKYLTIQNNKIIRIPAALGTLGNLETFKIYENNLTSIDEAVGRLTKLNNFNLVNNQLETLPDSMCYLLSNQNIRISLDYNKLCNDYPDCFKDLVNFSEGQDCSDDE